MSEKILNGNKYQLSGCYIEITSRCNLRCKHCYNESGVLKEEISLEALNVDKDNLGNGTLERKKKDSFAWYKKVIESDGEIL